MNALEAFVASLGILVAGFVTIPLAAWAVGAHVTTAQGAGMGALFFLARFAWLWLLRCYFERVRA